MLGFKENQVGILSTIVGLMGQYFIKHQASSIKHQASSIKPCIRFSALGLFNAIQAGHSAFPGYSIKADGGWPSILRNMVEKAAGLS